MPRSSNRSIHLRVEDDNVVVYVRGCFAFSSARRTKRLVSDFYQFASLSSMGKQLILDLSQVDEMDAAGFNTLTSIQKIYSRHERGGEVRFVTNEFVSAFLKNEEYVVLFKTYSSLGEATAQLILSDKTG